MDPSDPLFDYFQQKATTEAEEIAQLYRAAAAREAETDRINLQRMTVQEARYYAHLTPGDIAAASRDQNTEQYTREDTAMPYGFNLQTITNSSGDFNQDFFDQQSKIDVLGQTDWQRDEDAIRADDTDDDVDDDTAGWDR